VGLFFFLLSIVGVGLMISSLSLTQQQGLLGAFLFIVPSIILSGFATPNCQHAALGAAAHVDQPNALFFRDPAQRVSARYAISSADEPVLANGNHRLD
jgi:ABC-type transport system involved in multi-copper enzyme maturation permease subunit